jgi:hypothetical protein
MGQHSSDPNESLLPLLLAFAQLEGTYDQREKEQMFRLIGVVTDAHGPAGALARRRDRRWLRRCRISTSASQRKNSSVSPSSPR